MKKTKKQGQRRKHTSVLALAAAVLLLFGTLPMNADPGAWAWAQETQDVQETQETAKLFEIRLAEGAETVPVPEDGLACLQGEKAKTLQVVPGADLTAETIKYQWKKAASASGALKKINRQTKASYQPPTSEKGIVWYACDVTYTSAGTQTTVTTDRVKVTTDVTQASVDKKKPVLEEPLQGGNWKYGDEEAILTASLVPGENQSIRWYVSQDDGETWTETDDYGEDPNEAAMPGTGEMFLFLTELPAGTYQFKFLASYTDENLAGQSFTASTESNAAEVTIDVLQAGTWTGSGTQKEPYQLRCTEDLQKLSELSREMTFKGKYFEFSDEIGEEGISLPENWEPIGTRSKPFAGTINGNGKKLVVPDGERALIGVPFGATLQNLKIYGENIKGCGVVSDYSLTAKKGEAIHIEAVTLLSGTRTERSGFVGGYASGAYTVSLKDCTAEEGVIIGSQTQSNIGTFGGEFNGTMINCKSAATVRGKDFVGGIVGNKGQTMGPFEIVDCEFTGSAEGSGNYVGGIAGAGYGGTGFGLGSAGNTPMVTISKCRVSGTVRGGNYVGGILGAEASLVQCWDNGIGSLDNNLFTGSLSCSGSCKGAVAGFLGSLNRYTSVVNNAYRKGCGAADGIGCVRIIDTDCKTVKPEQNPQTIYLNTADSRSLASFPESIKMTDYTIKQTDGGFTNYSIKANHQRSDDPLGADRSLLSREAREEELASGQIASVPYRLTIRGSFKTEYRIGEALDLRGAIFEIEMTDGTKRTLTEQEAEAVQVSGFDNTKRAVQTLRLSYQTASAALTVTVLKPTESGQDQIRVSFTLLGDDAHGDCNAETGTHTLRGGNLNVWIPTQVYKVDVNARVLDVFEKALQEHGYSWTNAADRNYISFITTPQQVKLGEFSNGRLSGWMYTLNGTHPLLGLNEQFLNDGDTVIWHYTDDYTKEEGSDKWNTPAEAGDKPDPETEAAKLTQVKEQLAKVSLTARSAKTAKKNVKVTLKLNAESAAAIKEIQSLGYTVKYKFYRSTKKSSKYAAKLTKTSKSYLNTAGTKGSRYYYKARVLVYDGSGKLVAYSKLMQCKYAARIWSK